MGKVTTFFGHPLVFLNDDEKKELDTIGYSGKTSKGKRISRESYLNSLDKGEFDITQTKRDSGDFSEAFIIVKVNV